MAVTRRDYGPARPVLEQSFSYYKILRSSCQARLSDTALLRRVAGCMLLKPRRPYEEVCFELELNCNISEHFIETKLKQEFVLRFPGVILAALRKPGL